MTPDQTSKIEKKLSGSEYELRIAIKDIIHEMELAGYTREIVIEYINSVITEIYEQ